MRLKLPLALALGFAALLRCSWCGESPAKPELKTLAGGNATYYLSLPQKWNADSTWPIIVTIDGAGHNFSGNCERFGITRGSHPFIIVTPCVSSNGNDPADLKAVISIVEEVRKSFKGQDKFFMTGFSAGGHLTWQCVFKNPELLAGAALAAGNFRFRGVEEISKAPERVKLPIKEFLGEKDGAAFKQQWEDARKLATENGYETLSFVPVPDAGHDAFPQQVIEFFASLLKK